MEDFVLKEDGCHPSKIPILVEASSSKGRVLKLRNVEDDEYLRQYMLLHYQFKKTEGFSIKWEKFDHLFGIRSMDLEEPVESNAELIRKLTLTAIKKYNEVQEGTKLVFVEHVEANYQFRGGDLCWLTFWAKDMAASIPEPKIYQAKLWNRGKLFLSYIFRLRPTEEEIESVEVELPSAIYDEFNKPSVFFARPGPDDVALPGVPFVFNRIIGAGFDPDMIPPDFKRDL